MADEDWDLFQRFRGQETLLFLERADEQDRGERAHLRDSIAEILRRLDDIDRRLKAVEASISQKP